MADQPHQTEKAEVEIDGSEYALYADYVDCTCGHPYDGHGPEGCFPECGCTQPGTSSSSEAVAIERAEVTEWAVDFRGEEVGPIFRCIEAYPDRESALIRARSADKPLLRRTVTTTVTATPYEEVARG